MGTQQALTTKQLEFLILVESIEEFGKKNGNQTAIMEILTQDKFMTVEEYLELDRVLEYYGYLNEYGNTTVDGRQYVALFLEDLQKKIENPSIVINNQFTLINIEALNAGINNFVDIAGNSDIFKLVAEGVKKLRQFIKEKVTK